LQAGKKCYDCRNKYSSCNNTLIVSNNSQRPQYGIDAPDLVRLFFITGTTALAIFVVALLTSMFGQSLKITLSVLFGIAALYLLGMGCFMLYFSKVEKLKERDKLLNLVRWSGRELVLDVGCGRGLMLIGAAKRLSSGKAIGIDLWQQQDQANNSSAATEINAQIEGVTDRVEVKTADMRELPFPDNYFDVVTSNWTIHNLDAEIDRQKALNEIVRVLKPSGVIVIADIINQAEYAKYLQLCGMKNLELHNNAVRDAVLNAVTFGSFAPSAISARKDA
jgi:arsenite methyltransferase